jgi:hypothetical protein
MKNKLKLAYILLMLFDVSNAQNNESNKMTVRKSNQFIAVEQPALNVLYRGIENLIHIAYGGNCKLLVKINNGTIVDKLDGNYAVFVNDSASCEISIFEQRGKGLKNIGNRKYRVKSVPDPVPTFAGKRNGDVITKALMMQGNLAVVLENFLYDIRYEIVSFSISINICGEFKTGSTNGSMITVDQLALISKTKNYSKIIIEDIKVRAIGINSCVRTLPSISLRIVG